METADLLCHFNRPLVKLAMEAAGLLGHFNMEQLEQLEQLEEQMISPSNIFNQ